MSLLLSCVIRFLHLGCTVCSCEAVLAALHGQLQVCSTEGWQSVDSSNAVTAAQQALRRDLRSLEEEARAFAAALDEAGEWRGGGAALQALEGRYRFLWGIYCAHSEVRALPALTHGRAGLQYADVRYSWCCHPYNL